MCKVELFLKITVIPTYLLCEFKRSLSSSQLNAQGLGMRVKFCALNISTPEINKLRKMSDLSGCHYFLKSDTMCCFPSNEIAQQQQQQQLGKNS